MYKSKARYCIGTSHMQRKKMELGFAFNIANKHAKYTNLPDFITYFLLLFQLLTLTQNMQLSIGIIPEGGKARGMGKEALLDNIFVLDK